MDIHSRRIPSGYIHLIRHLTDALSESTCNIFIKCICDHDPAWETDGTHSCKVIVDGRRSVAVCGRHFSNTFCSCCLITSQSNHCIHLINGKLIQKRFPLFIIIGKSSHISKCKPVICPCSRHLGIRIFLWFPVGVVCKQCLVIFRHAVGGRCCRCFFIICKSICTGQIFNLSFCKIKLICGCYQICGTRVVTVIGHRLIHCIGTCINNRMGVCSQADLIISGFKNVCLCILIIIRCHVFYTECQRQCL